MAKEKWYMTTGRESREIKRNATKVMIGGSCGGVFSNDSDWSWSPEWMRTDQRLLRVDTSNSPIVAYTLGEKV